MKRKILPVFYALICITCLLISNFNGSAQTYCSPAYFEGCVFGNEINDFSLTGESPTAINDAATGCSMTSGGIGGGYDDRTAESVNLLPGHTYTVSVDDGGFTAITAGTDNFQIWIDFNNDGTFDASESVGGGVLPLGTGALTNFTITIPAGVSTGSRRMRAAVSPIETYPAVSPCPTSLVDLYGETHDYTAVIGTPSATCGAPTGLAVGSITSTSAVLSWGEPSGSVGSEYVVSTTTGTPTGSGTATTALTETSSSLTPSTVYYAWVRDSCGPGNLSAWVTTTFTTTATSVTTTCNPVSGLAATAITGTTATISWAAVPGSVGYIYLVNSTVTAPSSGGTFTTATSVPITGLTAGTTYYAHVRDSCGPGNESGWVTVPFSTTSTSGCNAETGLAVGSITSHSAIISWIPATGAVGAEYVVNTTATDPTASGTRTTASTYTATGLLPLTLYYAHVRDSCGATSLSAWVTIPFTTLAHGVGISNISAGDFGIAAFPNPVKNNVTIRINGTNSTMGQVQLFDISGKLIKTILTSAADTITIDMGGLPAGIYLVRYIDEANTQTIKINKQ